MEPLCTTPPARVVVSARRAADIDAKVVVEVAVVGGDHRLDQVVAIGRAGLLLDTVPGDLPDALWLSGALRPAD